MSPFFNGLKTHEKKTQFKNKMTHLFFNQYLEVVNLIDVFAKTPIKLTLSIKIYSIYCLFKAKTFCVSKKTLNATLY